MPDATAPSPSVVSSLAKDFVGPLLLGALINVWLYGAFLMQVHKYFRHAQNDHKWMKWMVIAILLIGTLNSAVSAYTAYDYAVTDFGRVDKVLRASSVFGIMVVTTAITGSIVQAFFGLRVKWLTGNTWIGWGITMAAFMQFLCGIGTIIGGYIVEEFAKFQKFRAVVIVWLVLAPITDLAISASLVHFLRSSRTGFGTTDDLLTKLTRLTIQTGLITAICALLDLVLFLSLNNNWHFVLNMALAKLYGNCLMSSLNARAHWAEEAYSNQGVIQNWYSSSSRSRPKPIDIKVTTSRGVSVDGFELDIPTDPYRHHHNNTSYTNTDTPVTISMPMPMRGSKAKGSEVEVIDIRQEASSPVLQHSKMRTKKKSSTVDDGLSFDLLDETENGSYRRI